MVDRDASPSKTPTLNEGTRATEPSEPREATLSAFDPPRQRFQFANELGSGGMGRVVAAIDRALDRPVAIKQALGETLEQLMRFEREVRITARLEHPAIVPIHDAGRDASGRPYYIMRKIEGQALSARLASISDIRERIALVPNMLAAVDAAAYAHSRRIIHRDIKPWNILIGPHGETLLIDWGLARQLDDEPTDDADPEDTVPNPISSNPVLTRAGLAYGTPSYMAPEQARGQRVDCRADVFALGATLFHVLVNHPPWESLEDARRGRPPPLERIPLEVPAELTAIVGKALAPDPNDRYRDAGELASDMRRFLAGQLVAAHRYTARERLLRFVRHHRVAIAVAVAAVIAIAVIGALAIAGVVRERDRAEAGQQLAAERAEQMLIERASSLATRDPTRSTALLGMLADGSRHLPRARDIAAVAASQGIAHGASSHRGAVVALEFAPDGRRLLSGGNDRTIQIHDVVTNQTTTLATAPQPIAQAVWSDRGATITYATTGTGLYVVDVASGITRTLDPDVHAIDLSATDDHIRYVDKNLRMLVELRTGEREPTMVAEDLLSTKTDGAWTMYLTHNGLYLTDGAHTRQLIPVSAIGRTLVEKMAVSTSLGRAAAVVSAPGPKAESGVGDLIEWELDGTERRRWPTRDITHLWYGGHTLYGHVADSPNVRLITAYVGDHVEEIARGNWLYAVGGLVDDNLAIATDDGALLVIDEIGRHSLPNSHAETLAIAGRSGSSALAIATAHGEVAWWDVRQRVPRPIRIPQDSALCGFSDHHLFVVEETRLLEINRDDESARVIVADLPERSCPKLQMIDRIVALREPPRGTLDLVDVATGQQRRIAKSALVPSDSDDATIAYRVDRTFYEIPPGGGPEIMRWKAPYLVRTATIVGRWLIVGLANNAIVRVDRTSGAVLTTPTEHRIAHVGATRDGEPWFIESETGTLFRVRNFAILEAATFQSDVERTDGTAVQLSDGSIWVVGTDQVTNLAARAPSRSAFFARGIALTVEGPAGRKRLVTRYLTGERIQRDYVAAIVSLASNGRNTAVQIGSLVAVYRDLAPPDPNELATWLRTATNAVVNDDDTLSWAVQ